VIGSGSAEKAGKALVMAQEKKSTPLEEVGPPGWTSAQQVWVVFAVVLLIFAGVLALIQWRHDPVKNLDSEDPEVRLEALDELGREKTERATEAIAGAIADPVDRVAVRALILLGPRARREHVAGMTEAARDKRPLVREAAVVAMGQFHLRRAVDAKLLYGILGDAKEEAEVRAAAAQSLARLSEWKALPKLAKALTLVGKEHEIIRDRAASAAEEIMGYELENLRSADWQKRNSAIRWIEQAGRSAARRQAHNARVALREKHAQDAAEAAAVPD